jgi:hypothetical protein
MRLNITPSFILAFLLLLLIMMELHELVHISVARLICGCWGSRDFNVWSLCEDCKSTQPLWWLATLAGPVFSYVMMWIGRAMLSSNDIQTKALGFSLVFTNIPFGRITTVMMGGGDEMLVLRYLMQSTLTRREAIILCSMIVLMIATPPIIRAGRAISNQKSWMHIAGFLTLPLFFLLIYLLTGLNGLLITGFLSQHWIMGTPLLITIHTGIALTGFVLLEAT